MAIGDFILKKHAHHVPSTDTGLWPQYVIGRRRRSLRGADAQWNGGCWSALQQVLRTAERRQRHEWNRLLVDHLLRNRQVVRGSVVTVLRFVAVQRVQGHVGACATGSNVNHLRNIIAITILDLPYSITFGYDLILT